MALLVSQLKLDFADQVLPAEYWFQVRLTDYAEHREQIRCAITRVVNRLRIDGRFALPGMVEVPVF